MWHYIARRDHWLMYRVNRWPAPRWVQWWMLGATRAGDFWLWLALGIVLLTKGGAARWLVLRACVGAGCSAVLLFLVLKRLTGRTRPCALEPHCWATLLPPDQFSFPSGHTMFAFSITTTLSLAYPAGAPLLLFCAVSIGASRVMLGMHFLSDVAAGAGLGFALGGAAYQLLV